MIGEKAAKITFKGEKIFKKKGDMSYPQLRRRKEEVVR